MTHKAVAYRITFMPHAHIRWGLYGADDLEKPIGTFANYIDAHTEMMRIIGSPHRFDDKGNRIE